MAAIPGRVRQLMLLCSSVILFIVGCKDSGTEPVDPRPQTGISFAKDIKPILELYGCEGCHGGSGGLFVGTVEQIMRGGDHGPAIVPGNAGASILMAKLSPTPPFGVRMPQGSSQMPESEQQKIRRWIDEGAQNN